MKKKLVAPLAIMAAATLAFSGCAANESGNSSSAGASDANLSGTLTGRGASSMRAAQEKWVADFQTKNPGVTVNYSPDGSGAGREAFTAGAVQFAGSDRALKDTEMGAGKFARCTPESNALNLPVYISPIAVIYNVQGVKDLKLDADTLAGIFSGKITKWNDPKIKALNASANLPATNITAVHRSDDSGTTNNFTDYLGKASTVWGQDASDTWPKNFKGEAAKGTSGVVDAVKTGTGTIGYADESATQGLDIADLKVGNEFVKPTPEAAAKIVDGSEKVAGRAEHDWALNLNRKAEGAYPAVLVSYAIVCEDYKDDKDAQLVKSYVGYIASADGQKSASESAGNAPLSDKMAENIKAAIDSIK
ncbi:phosphate ABC transporter substrate-binding protein PstS [Nigerium massiliense]|uniref:phosphate ABC transporter substrate-binding protein PstS n=1 Tax=Nigerium massiliense TaxID=1522317 RepID=UPI00058CF86E|nr:phosphate ABC transporter substrate-binding protein PstS [Nigerium massiliense]